MRKVRQAEGEANRFIQKLSEYAKSPDITETRLYLEAMEKVLPGVRKFLISGDVEVGGTDLWFLEKGAGALFETK